MIHSIEGKVAILEPNFIVIENNGIGYAVKTSMNTVSRMPQVGNTAKLFTYLHVKEDLLDLYGFATPEELRSFKMLIGISGVGPKAATSILSDLTPEKFALCVATGDSKSLTKAQGIGLKTAQRIVLELKDKISKEQVASGVIGESVLNITVNFGNASEAISALVVLGYAQSDATQIITKLDSEMSIENMIKEGLKGLAMKFD